MSNVIDVVDAGELQDLINTKYAVVVKFTAPAWCGPCRQFKPHYESAANAAALRSNLLGQTVFISVDIDNAGVWPQTSYGVQGVPNVMLYVNGQYVVQLQERTAPKLLNEIQSHLG